MIDIFSIGIDMYELKNIDNDKIIEYSKATSNKNNLKEVKSILSNNIFKNLNVMVEERMNSYYSTIYNNKYKIKLHEAWSNIGDDRLITIPHTHTGSMISAVYYADAEEGEIIFLNPSVVTDYQSHNNMIDVHNKYTSEHYSVPARTGHLLIFPSNLQHMVRCKNVDRVTIAYNGNIERVN